MKIDMRIVYVTLWVAAVWCVGCSNVAVISSADRSAENVWPSDWESILGNTITVEGIANDAKLGAVLNGQKNEIWMDGLDSWPSEIHGRRVRVTGKVIRRDDLPAFAQKPGEPQRSGTPVQLEEELERARRRYLLANATWKLLSN